MPFLAAFTVTQGSNCSQFTINDTSVYATEGTGTFSARKLTIQKSDGSYLKIGSTTYFEYVWPFASGNTLTLTITDTQQDFSFFITLALTSNAPQPGSTYVKSNVATLTCYTLSGFYTFAYNMYEL